MASDRSIQEWIYDEDRSIAELREADLRGEFLKPYERLRLEQARSGGIKITDAIKPKDLAINNIHVQHKDPQLEFQTTQRVRFTEEVVPQQIDMEDCITIKRGWTPAMETEAMSRHLMSGALKPGASDSGDQLQLDGPVYPWDDSDDDYSDSSDSSDGYLPKKENHTRQQEDQSSLRTSSSLETLHSRESNESDLEEGGVLIIEPLL